MRRRLFKIFGSFVVRHPVFIIAVALILTAITTWYSAYHIKLNANLDEMVSMKLDYHRRYIDFLNEFGDEEYLYVVADGSKDSKKAKEFVETLGTRLKSMPEIKQVIWKIDNPALEKNFLLYMTEDELGSLGAMTTNGPFAVSNIVKWDGFTPLFAALADRINKPVDKGEELELSKGFGFIDGLIDDMTDVISKDGTYKSRIQSLFFGNTDTFDPDGFLKNRDLFFILIMPAKDFGTMEVIEKPLDEIRGLIDATKKQFPDVDAGLTGRPVLSADEMMTSNRDMTRANILAMILMAALFIASFKGVVRPVLAQISLAIGISWTFGFVALVFGELNLLSIVFALILIGAVMEYAFRFVARYQEELSRAKGDIKIAIEETLVHSGVPDLTSATATACAFATLIWTDFTALAQLGIIAAVGVILCVAAILIVLPSLLVVCDRRRSMERLKATNPFGFVELGRLYRRPNALLVVSILVTAVLVFFIKNTGFDYNLLNLQAKNLESVKYEKMIIEKSNETTWFARATADTIEESHKKAELFKKLDSVRNVDDVERILPTNQKEKIGIVDGISPYFRSLNFVVPKNKIDVRRLMFELGRLASNLERLQTQAFTSGRVDAVEELDKFSAKIRKLVVLLGESKDDELKRVGVYQEAFFDDLQKNIKLLATGMHPARFTLKDLPQDLVSRFVSPKGKFSLMIYPKENIWDPNALGKFVDDIRKADATVLGTPVEVHESGRIMRETFVKSACLAMLLIIIFAWLDSRSWRATILSVIPLVLGTIWLVGIMGAFGIKFNMANFFAIPILIGTGIDFGVHLIHRLRLEKSFAAIGTSTGRGLILTAASNAVGFGSLIIASHRGIASLGIIMMIGSICALLVTLIALPPIAKHMRWGD